MSEDRCPHCGGDLQAPAAKKDPPLPQLSEPNIWTIHDLPVSLREQVKIKKAKPGVPSSYSLPGDTAQ